MKVRFRDMKNPYLAIALSGGLGLLPWMPGTFGAAGAFVLYLFVAELPQASQLGLVIALFAIGCLVSRRAAAALGGKDPSVIVLDETVGMLITLVLIPATPVAWLTGFLAFRILDINKPWLIGTAERRFRGGLAIMADDALAGLAAAGVVWTILGALGLLTRG